MLFNAFGSPMKLLLKRLKVWYQVHFGPEYIYIEVDGKIFQIKR